MKLAELADAIGKTRGNTYNAAKRLIDKEVIAKRGVYYSLPSQNGSVPDSGPDPREPVSLLGPEAR